MIENTLTQTEDEKIAALEEQFQQAEHAPDIDPVHLVNLMNELGWVLRKSDPERTRSMALRAHDLATTQSYHRGTAYSLRNWGISAFLLETYDVSLDKLLAAKTLFEQLDEATELTDTGGTDAGITEVGLIDTHLYTSAVYGALGDYSNALSFGFQTLDLAKRVDYIWGLVQSLHKIHIIYCILNEYREGIKYGEESLVFADMSGDLNDKANVLNSLAVSYKMLAEYAPALEYSQQSLRLIRQASYPDLRLEANILDTLGTIYTCLDDETQAISYLNECIDISHKLNYTQTEIEAQMNIGKIYQTSNPVLAIDYFQNILAQPQTPQTKRYQAQTNQYLFEI
ncbi:MAG: tetratricopeptide repeat protein, partial [Chloroflexota bacterium]